MTIRQYVCMTDSLTLGIENDTDVLPSVAQGGLGNWAELVAERLANIAGIGPLLSSGFRGSHIHGLTEWIDETGGAWTAIQSGAEDKAPGPSYYSPGSSVAIYKYRVPSHYRRNVGFDLYYIDRGGNWSYRVDGGSWINMGQTSPTDSKTVKKFYVALAAASTVEVRAANAAGTSQALQIAGIGLWYVNPVTATQGLIMHNLSVGGQALHTRMSTTGGRDKMAIVDSVTLGTGSPITNTPNAGVFQWDVNDIDQIGNVATWDTDLRALNTRVSGLGPVGFINGYEMPTVLRPAADQLAYRNQTKTTAAAISVPVYDLYDYFASKGITGIAGMRAYSLLIPADGHQSQVGHLAMAEVLYWWFRTQFFNIGNIPSAYVATAKRAAVAYTAKQAAVAYAASAPIGVGA